MLLLRVIALFLLLLYSLFAYARTDHEIAESHKCSELFSYFEKKYRIPNNTLHSIALKESGKKHKEHKILIVWPWTVNVEGQGYYFNRKYDAISFVKKQIIKGKENIDVGCMQINLKHHLDAFDSLEEAFDPAQNIRYGAEFLRSKYEQLGNWHKAIAHYHSATYLLGTKYKQDVVKIASKMSLYKDVLKMYNNQQYYTENSLGQGGGNTAKMVKRVAYSDDKKSFLDRSKRYRSNIMVPVPVRN